ncbi:MAG: bifunctional folylpolyglutamate synthase/dihydrofolate synthase [Solirubrobacterales bacterium]|nr:bifunctional folylpolyglutamate synthase/dihydrofolate synthase [Solirubrobacterales bacterium]
MELLCAALGDPQTRFPSLHVVGTNGKSSVTAMAAALLSETGLRAGSCLSPHVRRWSERTRIDGVEIAGSAFGDAVEEVAAAIRDVEADLSEDERITQFEAAIAASFVALARAEVDVAVIEAGLGGRLDATNVIPSRATALTSVGLDHVEWLGRTQLAIAGEKLAVLREGTTLVVGRLEPEVADLARRTAMGRGAKLITPDPLDPGLLPPAMAPYLARNAAVAVGLAEVFAGEISPAQVRRGLSGARLPGRAQLLGGEPPLLADAAHNEEGARALAEALPALAQGRPVIACMSILADKDAPAIVNALAPALEVAVCTAAEPGPAMGRPGARAAEPGGLVELFEAAGVQASAVPDPERAVAEALERARRASGVALCAGSHYLLRYAWTAKHAQSCSR